MTRILLARHSQSFANKRDFAAFGNVDSPLTERGTEQSHGLGTELEVRHGITPATYGKAVLASEYRRTQETAETAGFTEIHISPLINEADVDREIMSGLDVIRKHTEERWVAEEIRPRAAEFIDKVQSGELDYEIYFTHGMFIASVLLECDARNIATGVPFDAQRGYVPLQATIIPITL